MQINENPNVVIENKSGFLVPRRLSIGLLYNPALPDFLREHLESWDYLEVIPDMFWMDKGVGQIPRFVILERWVEFLEYISKAHPVVAHNIGLSLGSADIFDVEYVDQLGEWRRRFNFVWHSDHLSFVRVPGDNGFDHNAGLAVPVPYDNEVLDLIANRISTVRSSIAIPFLIENNVYYVDIPDQDMSEPEFLNKLSARTGCGLLLDLHNLYANARNHGFSARDFLRQLDLSRVIEIHIAGGNEMGGMYTDSHAGPCPEPVWDLLDCVVPNASNLCGITFEFHESYYPLLKTEGILDQLDRARAIWNRGK